VITPNQIPLFIVLFKLED